MFGIGAGVILFVTCLAAIYGRGAPDWMKVGGSLAFLVGIALCCASVAVMLWRVML